MPMLRDPDAPPSLDARDGTPHLSMRTLDDAVFAAALALTHAVCGGGGSPRLAEGDLVRAVIARQLVLCGDQDRPLWESRAITFRVPIPCIPGRAPLSLDPSVPVPPALLVAYGVIDGRGHLVNVTQGAVAAWNSTSARARHVTPHQFVRLAARPLGNDDESIPVLVTPATINTRPCVGFGVLSETGGFQQHAETAMEARQFAAARIALYDQPNYAVTLHAIPLTRAEHDMVDTEAMYWNTKRRQREAAEDAREEAEDRARYGETETTAPAA